jgi:hypothetical protein
MNEANPYRDRARLSAALAAQFPSCFVRDESEPDWKVLIINLPKVGQISYHISPDDMDLFNHVKDDPTCKWDGHTTEEKNSRIENYTQYVATIDAGIDEASM